ncbi:MAG TPA: alkaline phosphatase family protein [Anaerolineaceae bacterium]|nr:alkaline phosphatase family protein [Anaerolineaceae bacterium]
MKLLKKSFPLELILFLAVIATSCSPLVVEPSPAVTSPRASPGVSGKVPVFSHVIVIILENEEASNIIGNSSMPSLNYLAQSYAVLTNYYAVSHPSLPNYIALTSGDTQGISSDCTDCFVNQTNLMDLIEKSGRTWKAYMEDMPGPCALGNSGKYAQKHNPFVYYDDIRTSTTRCQQNDVPFSQFASDLQNKQLPAFAWITPNLCNDAHDCPVATADQWLAQVVDALLSSPAFDQNSLLVITFDEGTTTASCCGLPPIAGGKIATILISRLIKPGFQDATPYSHYSLLKTIETSWGLQPLLGHSADSGTNIISAPWK